MFLVSSLNGNIPFAAIIPINCKPHSNDVLFISFEFNKDNNLSYSNSNEHFQFSTINLYRKKICFYKLINKVEIDYIFLFF